MANNFSIEKAASDTRITRKPGILVKIFRGLLLSQFKEIKYGCIVLNEGEERIVFGDENSSLKVEAHIYSDEFYVLAGSGGDLGIAEAYSAGYWDSDDMVKIIQIVIKNQNIQIKTAYESIQLLNQIGQEITSHNDFEKILNLVYHYTNLLMDATVFGIGIYHPQNHEIEYKLAIESGKKYQPYSRSMEDKNQLPVWCIENGKTVVINDIEKEYTNYIDSIQHFQRVLEDGSSNEFPQSYIYEVLKSRSRTIGVITVQSFQKNAYAAHHIDMVKTIALYTSIALEEVMI